MAWILGKKKKLLPASETVNEGMLASIEEAVTDEKTLSIVDLIKQIPIADTSTMRRVRYLALDVLEVLLAEVTYLATDEWTDNSGVAQFASMFDSSMGNGFGRICLE